MREEIRPYIRDRMRQAACKRGTKAPKVAIFGRSLKSEIKRVYAT